MKNKRGITLIALIISIIVVLILAGVSINAIVGENGVLTQAQNTVKKNSIATYDEIIKIESASAGMEMLEDPEEYLEAVKEGLKVHPEFAGATYTMYPDKMVVKTKDGYDFIVYAEDGSVKYAGTEEEVKAGMPSDLTSPDIEVMYDNKWTKSAVTVTANCPKYPGFDIVYSYDGINSTRYTSPLIIENNTEVYFQLANPVTGIQGGPTRSIKIDKIDKKAPSIKTGITEVAGNTKTKEFTVYCEAQDTDLVTSGEITEDRASGIAKIVWYYKETSSGGDYSAYGTDDPEDIKHASPSAENGTREVTRFTKKFENLSTVGGTYSVYAKIYDVAGTPAITEAVEITTLGGDVQGQIGFLNSGNWTNLEGDEVRNVTLPTGTGLTTLYAYSSGELSSSPQPYSGPINVTENCWIYWKVVDASDNTIEVEGGGLQVNCIDANNETKNPVVNPHISLYGTAGAISVETTITVQDTVSGFSHITWHYKEKTDTIWNDEEMETTHSKYTTMKGATRGTCEPEEIRKTFSGLNQVTTYQFYAEVYDVAGNKVLSPTGGASNPLEITTGQIMVNSISLGRTTGSLTGVGSTLTIGATVLPEDALNKTLQWFSDNEDVATVSNGVVTAVSGGSCTITAKSTDRGVASQEVTSTNSCAITVTVNVTGVTIGNKPTNNELEPGGTCQLTATVAPPQANNKSVTWNSSKTNVATIESDGTITAVAAGTTTIKATSNQDSSKKDSFELTVIKDVFADYTSFGTLSQLEEGSTYVGYYVDVDMDGVVDRYHLPRFW